MTATERLNAMTNQLTNFGDLPFATKAYYTVIFTSVLYLAFFLVSYIVRRRREIALGLHLPPPYAIEELLLYNGTTKHMPRYVALTNGKVMDVSQFVKEEKNLALLDSAIVAAQSTKEGKALGDNCKVKLTTGEPGELKPEQLQTVKDMEEKAQKSCLVAGRLVDSLRLTLDELAEYGGQNKDKQRLLLSVQGSIFDVTSGSQFYGPSGFYPFAGREVARALAKHSVEDKDCNDKVDDLSKSELDDLKGWIEKFQMKYPLVGTIVKGKQ